MFSFMTSTRTVMVVRTFIIATSGMTTIISPSFADNTKKDFKQQKIVIVGGGTAGVGVAVMLRNEGMKNVIIVEPKGVHYYQPLWTLVGGGIKKNTQSSKEIERVIPTNVTLIKSAAKAFDPKSNSIELDDGRIISYDCLVVAAGIQSDWGKIPGLVAALNDKTSGVVSIYDYKYCAEAWDVFNSIEKGRIIFTMPNTLIKCAGAPQKIMWLIEEMLRDKKIRQQTSVEFWVPGAAMFGIKRYSDQLEEIRKERDVIASFKQELVSIDGANKIAVFKSLTDNTTSEQKYDVIHVVPPMSPPTFIKNSVIADANGWVDVNRETLQSTKYPNIFSLGDCCNTPNSKTAAAITSQAPVLVHNLMQYCQGKGITGVYNGYASCPLIIGKNKVILAEFGFEGKIKETFDKDMGKVPYFLLGYAPKAAQQYIFYWMKETMFPFVYWTLWMRGYWFGTSGPFKPNVVPPENASSKEK